MIDIRKLKELVKLMVQNDLTEMDLRDSEEQVTLHRPNHLSAPQIQQVAAAPPSTAAPAPAVASVPETTSSAPAPQIGGDDRSGLSAVESPMVGTYYSSPSPDADPFISVGESIAEGDVVCLLEAMKIFNEIQSEVSGTVEKILVKNGDAVEFGQELMLVRPA